MNTLLQKTHTLKFRDISLLIYLCTLTAHQSGAGADVFIVRFGFIQYIMVEFFMLLLKGKIKFNTLTIWYAVFVVFNFLSVFWARDAALPFGYFNQFIQIIFLLFFLTQRITCADDIRLIIKLVVLSLFYMAAFLYIRTPNYIWGTDRIGEGMGLHPNAIGMMMAIGTVLCLYLIFDSKKEKLQVVCCAAGYVLFAVLAMLTGSRKAIAMFIIMTAGFLLATRSRKLTLKNLLVYALLIALLVFSAFKLLSFIMTNEAMYAVLGRRLTSMLGGASADASIRGRNILIEDALTLFSQHPVLGVGGDNYVFYHQVYSHNNFTELLATLGIVGFGLYYWLPAVTLFRLTKIFIRDNQNRLAVLLLIILATIVVFSWWNVNYQTEFMNLFIALAYFAGAVLLEPALPAEREKLAVKQPA